MILQLFMVWAVIMLLSEVDQATASLDEKTPQQPAAPTLVENNHN